MGDKTHLNRWAPGRLLTGAAQSLISTTDAAEEERITREVLESIPLDIDASEDWLQSDIAHMDDEK